MLNTTFRLRINFQKRDCLRMLSHLELVRAMERMIRRSQLPFAVSQGFNTHMKHAPGPALPVGTSGLDEYFDLWMRNYVRPDEAVSKLRAASVEGIEILACSFVSPSARGLQATHVNEIYEVCMVCEAPETSSVSVAEVEGRLAEFVAQGTLEVARKKKTKRYDLKLALGDAPTISNVLNEQAIIIRLHLRSSDQGSIKPEVLLTTALGKDSPWQIQFISRVKLFADEG